MKIALGIFLVALGLSAFAAGGFLWWYQSQLQPVSDTEEAHFVMVEEGMSAGRVATILEAEGVIRNELAFYVYARARGQASNLQAGYYRLSPSQSVADIVTVLSEGEVDTLVVTIPEGSNLDDIAVILRESGFSRDEIEAALSSEYDLSILNDRPDTADLEGYLYPETYHAPGNFSAEQLVEMILTHTDTRVDAELREQWEDNGLNVHEALTLASLVERESPVDDMPDIAGVFFNRLDNDMKLESDATINYILGTNNLQSSYADTEVDDPYNTYQNHGLPPGPIGSAGQAALEAVANPSTHDWLFFLHKPDEETVFSLTFEEHERNRERYLD